MLKNFLIRIAKIHSDFKFFTLTLNCAIAKLSRKSFKISNKSEDSTEIRKIKRSEKSQNDIQISEIFLTFPEIWPP